MPNALGSRNCPVVSCRRPIHVTAGGTVFARCLAHTLALLTRSFASPRDAAPVASPDGGRRATRSGVLPARSIGVGR